MIVIAEPAEAPQGASGRRREQNSAYGSLRRTFLTIVIRTRSLRRVVFLAHLTAATHVRCRLGAAADAAADRAAAGQVAGRDPSGPERPPGEGRQPELPAAAHPRLQATIDAGRAGAPGAACEVSGHRHPQPPADADFGRPTSIASMQGMEANNLRLLVNLSGGSGDRLQAALEAMRASKYPDRMVLFANVDFRERRPRLWRRGGGAARSGHQGRRHGAARSSRISACACDKTDGTRLKLDDPELDPIWAACARLNVPVLIHTAEPQEFFEPHRLSERTLAGARAVSRSAAIRPTRRPALRGADGASATACSRSHPKTRFILAHFG